MSRGNFPSLNSSHLLTRPPDALPASCHCLMLAASTRRSSHCRSPLSHAVSVALLDATYDSTTTTTTNNNNNNNASALHPPSTNRSIGLSVPTSVFTSSSTSTHHGSPPSPHPSLTRQPGSHLHSTPQWPTQHSCAGGQWTTITHCPAKTVIVWA